MGTLGDAFVSAAMAVLRKQSLDHQTPSIDHAVWAPAFAGATLRKLNLVFPAKAGTHTPRPLERAHWETPSFQRRWRCCGSRASNTKLPR